MKSMVLFFLAQFPGEVVFNEVMFDPLPSAGLPGYEYVELFNRSGSEISLGSWTVETGAGSLILPGLDLAPGAYVLLVYPGTAPSYPRAGNTLEVMNKMTLLHNEGDLLCLRDAGGDTVDWLRYGPYMHEDVYFAGGGWSLERIDPDRPCGESSNWTTSRNRNGGTPGFRNTVVQPNPDRAPPEIEWIRPAGHNAVSIRFSEPMQHETLIEPGSYQVRYCSRVGGSCSWEDSPVSLIEAATIPPECREVILTFDRNLDRGRVYGLGISGIISDCSGLRVDRQLNHRFGIPSYPENGDLLISEVLFEPLPGCPEFIEICNHAENPFDLADVRLRILDGQGEMKGEVVAPVSESRLIYPGDLVVFTDEKEALQQCCRTGEPGLLVEVNAMPSLDNKEGGIQLLDRQLGRLDVFRYSRLMHFPLLSSTAGVSLERLSYGQPASQPSNWHSASDMEGFATPARPNSHLTAEKTATDRISVEPEVFSPNQDGRDDLCLVRYRFSGTGIIITIRIFDAKGRLVRSLKENALVAGEGFIAWDGTDGKGKRARSGIYLILTQVYDLSGKTWMYKDTCVLSPGR